jgi:hypothetical protein
VGTRRPAWAPGAILAAMPASAVVESLRPNPVFAAIPELTGLGNRALRPEVLGAACFHIKAGLGVLALTLSGVHDFVLGPQVGRPGAGPTARVRASWIARLNALVAFGIVALGLSVRG